MAVLLALGCGLIIGAVLGALGGGGAILAVPALVYVLGESAQDATTASLVVIGISSAIGAVSYHRDRHVRWGVALIFGVVGIGASFAGTALNRTVSESVLLGSFASIVAVSAIAMFVNSWSGRGSSSAASEAPSPQPSTPTAPGRFHGLRILIRVSVTKGPSPSQLKVAAQIVLTALSVGFLTGFLGVGGGFIVVPALVMILRFPMRVATGTSLMVIALNAAVSLGIHAGSSPHLDWAVIVPFTAAAIVASLVGKHIAGRFSSNTLTLSFAVVLLLVATAIGVQIAAPHIGLS